MVSDIIFYLRDAIIPSNSSPHNPKNKSKKEKKPSIFCFLFSPLFSFIACVVVGQYKYFFLRTFKRDVFLVFPTFKDSRRLHDVKGTSEKGPAKVLKRSHTNWISLTTYSPLGINIYARPSLTLKVVNLSFFIRAMTRIRLVRKKKETAEGGGGVTLEKKKKVYRNITSVGTSVKGLQVKTQKKCFSWSAYCGRKTKIVKQETANSAVIFHWRDKQQQQQKTKAQFKWAGNHVPYHFVRDGGVFSVNERGRWKKKKQGGGQGVTKAYQGDYFRTSFHGRPHNNARKK